MLILLPSVLFPKPSRSQRTVFLICSCIFLPRFQFLVTRNSCHTIKGTAKRHWKQDGDTSALVFYEFQAILWLQLLHVTGDHPEQCSSKPTASKRGRGLSTLPSVCLGASTSQLLRFSLSCTMRRVRTAEVLKSKGSCASSLSQTAEAVWDCAC